MLKNGFVKTIRIYWGKIVKLYDRPGLPVEIIGETATKITKECQKDLSQIPWPNIIGMRNRLIHAYFDINLEILWKTVTEDLPGLIDELEKILPSNKV